MVHLIDKDALIAKILRLKGLLLKGACASQISMQANCKEEAYNETLSILDTLEVKEVDLEKEIKKEYLKRRHYNSKDNMLVILNELQFNTIAKYFFELGLKAQKGE